MKKKIDLKEDICKKIEQKKNKGPAEAETESVQNSTSSSSGPSGGNLIKSGRNETVRPGIIAEKDGRLVNWRNSLTERMDVVKNKRNDIEIGARKKGGIK